MARTQVAVAALAMALVGCGYEPAADRGSDPLSPDDRVAVKSALKLIALICKAVDVGVTEGGEDEIVEGDVKTLTRLARKHPHGVYRPRGEIEFVDHGSFSGDTMIQVLERAAHEFDDCLPDASEDMRRSAELLRSPR